MRWTEALAALALMVGMGLGQSAQGPPAKGPLPEAPNLPPIAAPAPMAPVQPPRFAVVVDAAHGGSDTGAKIGSGVLEKDITLATRRAASVSIEGTRGGRGDDAAGGHERDSTGSGANRECSAGRSVPGSARHGDGKRCAFVHVISGSGGTNGVPAVDDGAGVICDAEHEVGVGD